MDHEFQNEANRTRHILKMKQLARLIKDKKSFDSYLIKLERMQRLRALVRVR